jgi:hypothetical protein
MIDMKKSFSSKKNIKIDYNVNKVKIRDIGFLQNFKYSIAETIHRFFFVI